MKQKGLPSLCGLRWIKGGAPSEGKVVVIDVWASWCGPCMKSIPHLIELQSKHGSKLQVCGLTDEPHDKIASMAGMLGAVNYAIAADAGSVTRPLMEDNGQNGIPCCFSRDGKLVLVAHPMDPKFDETVAQECAKAGVFEGVGHSLGGASAPKAHSSQHANYPFVALDETKPVVVIQVRTPQGAKAFKLNASNTVANLKALIVKETGHNGGSFGLQRAYPKQLVKDEQTLESFNNESFTLV